ncbi:fatty acid--CoA ligase [Pseudomonas sp. SWI44]|uniref:fatty acid--CoA ligase n=1 Tax=Pseudomonas sp. SWI44 TaxID=2083053 RepID=UPI000CE5F374|nr:fatty acid--CoA ligase [Pseudomonas sp. SWI44]AVD90045.1 long-chain fatty acid--CoA ligase [Pseudomonas sp. SWI44]
MNLPHQPKFLASTESFKPSPLLIAGLLEAGVRAAGSNSIVYRDISRYDYPTLNRRVHQLAHALVELGVKAGDTVAVLDWDSHRYLECFFAIPMLGAVLHTVNVRLAAEQVQFTMAHAEDTLVLTHRDFIPLLESIDSQLPSVRGYVLCEGQEHCPETSLPVLGEYEALLTCQPTHFEFPEFDENAVATLFYTTGTTGNPKGVYFTHRQLVLHTLAGATAHASAGSPLLSRDKVYMPITPMFHVHAWGVPYIATMMGCKQVYPGRYEAKLLASLIESECVSYSHCVPTLLAMVLDAAEVSQADLSGWHVLVGGSALSAGLARKALAMNVDVRGAYGMSETCPIISLTCLPADLTPDDEEQQLHWRCSAGVIAPLVQMKLVDEAHQALPQDGHQVGQLLVRSPWLTTGYFKDPDSSEKLWQGGWLHTGDVASIDPNGLVHIHDRLKDLIKTGGEWISSLDIESLISRHPHVRECAVVGLPDARWGERPVALIVQTPSTAALDVEALKTHLMSYVNQGALSKWAIPTEVRVVADIPRTSVGKLDKKLIRTQF